MRRGDLVDRGRQKIVGACVSYGLSDSRVAGNGVDGHNRALETAIGRKTFQQHRDGRDLVGFIRDGFLPEYQAAGRGEGRDEMERRLALAAIMAAPRCLAVDGDQFGPIRPARAHPACEAGRKQRRIDPIHHDRQPAPTRNTMIIRQKSAQKLKMPRTPQPDRIIIVAIRNRTAHDQKKDLRQRKRDPMRRPWILDHGKMIQQQPKPRLLSKLRSVNVHGRISNAIRPIDSAFQSIVKMH